MMELSFTKINRKLDLNNNEDAPGYELGTKLARGIDDQNKLVEKKARIEKNLSVRDARDLYLLGKDAVTTESLTPERFSYLSKIRALTNLSEETLKQKLPTNEELYFCAHVKEKKLTTSSEIGNLARQFGLSEENVNMLRSRRVLDFVNDKERLFLDGLTKGEESLKLSKRLGLARTTYDDLKSRGFVRAIEGRGESSLLRYVADHSNLSGDELAQAAQFFLVSPKRLQHLRSSGFIDMLADNENSFLRSYIYAKKQGRLAALKEAHGIAPSVEMKLKKRLTYHSANEVKAVDRSGYLQQNESTYIARFIELKAKTKSTKDLKTRLKQDAEVLRIDKKKAQLLEKRVTFFSGREIKDIALGARISFEPQISLTPKWRYNEPDVLLAERERHRVFYQRPTSPKDTYLLMHAISESKDKLTKTERVILSELKSAGSRLDSKDVLSNAEKAFLTKINGRKNNQDPQHLAATIASKDFGIEGNRVEYLVASGVLSLKDNTWRTHYREPKEFSEIRIKRAERGNAAPRDGKSQVLTAILSAKGDWFKLAHEAADYLLYFKMLRKEELTLKDQGRLTLLRENGLNPEGSEFKQWVHTSHPSFRAEALRLSAFREHYKSAYGVNMEALDMVNRFKQVTKEQLKDYVKLTDEEITRYAKGIPTASGKPSGLFPLLKEEREFTSRGAVTYYSLTHSGVISGRSMLEERLLPKDIAEKPQNRKDLLIHDLRVVDSVFRVKIELEKKGVKILDIKNEATQYGDVKKGVLNEHRIHGPAFMDAVIITDEEVEMQGGGRRNKIIAVEYGNYDPKRMESKLRESIYDEAHVFAEGPYIKQYIQKIGHIPGVRYRVF